MTDSVFQIQLPDGRTVGIQAASPEEAAQGARNILAREQGEAQGKNDGTGSFIDNVGRSVARGASLGFADEFAAGMDALTHGLLGRGSNADTLAQRYAENLAKERGQDTAFDTAHPYVSGAGKIAGGVATSVAALPTMAPGASMLGNMARFGGTGAVLGGIQGFGEGDGGFANRMGNAATGAALGGVTAAALPVVGTVANKITDEVGAPFLNKLADALDRFAPSADPEKMTLSAAAADGGHLPPSDSFITRAADALRAKAGSIDEDTALRNIGAAMLKQKSTPESLMAKYQELGPDTTFLADLGDRLRAQLNAARLESPEVDTLTREAMANRAEKYGDLLLDAIPNSRDVPSVYRLQQAMAANETNVGNDLYGQMRAAGLNVSPEMQAIIDKSPRVQNLINNQIPAEAAANGDPLTDVDVMHKVKEALDQKLNSVTTGDSNYLDKGGIINLANNFRGAFHEANPVAAAADEGMAIAKSLPENLSLGQQFMRHGTSETATNVSPEALFDRYAENVPQQNAAFQAGATNTYRDLAQYNPTGLANSLRPGRSADLYARLTQIYGPDVANAIKSRSNAVRTYVDTANKVTGGSSTIPNASDIAEFNHAKIGIGKSGFFERIQDRLGEMLGEIEQPSERATNKIGEMLLTRDPQENERVLNLIADLLQRKGVRTVAGASAANQAASNLEGQ